MIVVSCVFPVFLFELLYCSYVELTNQHVHGVLHMKILWNFTRNLWHWKTSIQFDFLKEHLKTSCNETVTKTLVNFTRESFFEKSQKKNSRFLAKFGAWLWEEMKFPVVVFRCISGFTSSSEGKSSKNLNMLQMS